MVDLDVFSEFFEVVWSGWMFDKHCKDDKTVILSTHIIRMFIRYVKSWLF